MAKSEFTKNIKLTVDLKQAKEDVKKADNMFSMLAESFQEKLFGGVSKRLQSRKTIDIDSLKNRYTNLFRQKKTIEENDEVSSYLKKLEQLNELQGKDKRTEEEEKLFNELSKYFENLNELKELYSVSGPTEETAEFDKLFELLQQLTEIEEEAKDIQEEISKQSKPKEETNRFKTSFKSISDGLANAASSAIQNVGESIKSYLKDAFEEFKNVSSFSLGTSLKINQTARENALMYGLSDAQNYAFEKAKEELGASSMEDLYYMTPAQQERFSERIGYWSGKYNELANKDAFKTFEEVQAELNDVKSDLQMTVVSFIADNKTLIIESFKVMTGSLSGILKVVSWISELLGFNETKESVISDTINNYATSSNSNTSIKIDNSFTGISSDDVTKLRRAGNEVNNQIINALK